MWKKVLIIILIFYLFALLQSSFLVHFNPYGITLNLVFILFSLLVFFEGPKGHPGNSSQILFLSVTAGFFLDIFSYTYIGPSIVAFIIIGFLLKKTQSLLKNREDNRPFVYFLPLFLIFFIVYEILLMLFLHFIDSSHALISFDLKFAGGIIYNSLIASVLFFIFKRFFKKLNG
jgi:rod shape-determining protein MreD